MSVIQPTQTAAPQIFDVLSRENSMRFRLLALSLVLAGCQATTPVKENDGHEVVGSEISMEVFCQAATCRGPTTIKLKTKGEDFIEELPMFWPVVHEDAISILPGEKLYIEAEVSGERLTGLKIVDSNNHSEHTIVVSFTQNDSDIGMMLALSNPFDKPIKFNMAMMDFSGGWHKTSSCPVLPGLSIYETWPHPIVQLYIGNPRILSTDTTVGCEY